jgi:hypothetical protein
VKRSVLTRLFTLASVILLATVSAGACTVAPPPVKVSWNFQALSLPSPGAGIDAGDNAKFLYAVSNVPRGARVEIQRGVTSKSATTWTKVVDLAIQPLASGTLVKPPFGRNSYRVAVLDAHKKLLASATHTLDVYLPFTLGLLANRPLQTVSFDMTTFAYYFQAEIDFARTSCRQLTGLTMLNKGTASRSLQVTLANSPALTYTYGLSGGNIFEAKPLATIPGQELDLQVLNNATLGNTMYVRGNAVCFTGNGNY